MKCCRRRCQGFDDDDSLLAAEQKLTTNAKKVALMTLGTAAQKYMMKLAISRRF